MKVRSLNHLACLVAERRAIVTQPHQGFGHQGYIAASWVFNLNAAMVHAWLRKGMYVYKPKHPRRLRNRYPNGEYIDPFEL